MTAPAKTARWQDLAVHAPETKTYVCTLVELVTLPQYRESIAFPQAMHGQGGGCYLRDYWVRAAGHFWHTVPHNQGIRDTFPDESEPEIDWSGFPETLLAAQASPR